MASVPASLTNYLSDHHKTQISTFVKFSRGKRDETLKEIQGEFDDTKELRIVEDVYSADDVRSIIDNLCSSIKSSVQKELEQFSQANSLFIRHLLLQAEGHGVDSLRIDPNVIHDESLMGDAKKSVSSAKLADLPSLSAAKLAPLQGAVDVGLVTKVKDLEEANQRSQERFNKLQHQFLELQKKFNDTRSQLESTESAYSASQAAASSALNASQAAQSENAALASSSAATNAEVARLKSQIDSLQQEVATRIAQTKQFQDLKKMVMQKNNQIKELRTRLEKYEPSSSAGGSMSAGHDDSDQDSD